MWKLDQIKPYKYNSRTHPPQQIALLAQMFIKWGPDQPIVVDENAEILKGHGRLEGAYKAEFEEFPVVQRFGLSDDDKRAMRIADNQVALLAGWDNSLVKFEIEALNRNGYDLKLLAFGEKQLVQFQTTIGPPAAFKAFGEDIDTEHECPKCRYRWSGNSSPAKDPEPQKTPRKTAAKKAKTK